MLRVFDKTSEAKQKLWSVWWLYSDHHPVTFTLLFFQNQEGELEKLRQELQKLREEEQSLEQQVESSRQQLNQLAASHKDITTLVAEVNWGNLEFKILYESILSVCLSLSFCLRSLCLCLSRSLKVCLAVSSHSFCLSVSLFLLKSLSATLSVLSFCLFLSVSLEKSICHCQFSVSMSLSVSVSLSKSMSLFQFSLSASSLSLPLSLSVCLVLFFTLLPLSAFFNFLLYLSVAEVQVDVLI